MVDLSPHIGKIFGIDVQIHWISILFIALVVLTGNVSLIIIFIALFFCVLLHELAHSITANKKGVKVKKIIIILPIGGGSIIDNNNIAPNLEYIITAAGPLMSIVIAAVFYLFYIAHPWSSTISYILYSLFLINIFLGVLNLLPWFPLDGGRMLRSYLQKTKSFFAATKISVNVSKVVTVLFVIGSIIYFSIFSKYSLQTQILADVFTIFIAFFIYSGAREEMRMAYAKQYTADLKAADAMGNNYLLVKSNAKLDSIYKMIRKKHVHLVLFKQNAKIKAFYFSGQSANSLSNIDKKGISQLGVEIPSIDYSQKLYRAIEIMRLEEKSIIAVTRHRKIVGLISEQHAEALINLHISKKLAVN